MELQTIQSKIYEIRGQKIMLDYDLAELYDVQTKALNLAVKRNIKRFPADFMFRLSQSEWESLRFQFETLNNGRGQHRKYPPYAFTEQGLAMLSGILNSDKAIEMNISIMRAFVLIRQYALSYKELSDKLEEMALVYDKQFDDLYEAMNHLLKKDVQHNNQVSRKSIGFKSE